MAGRMAEEIDETGEEVESKKDMYSQVFGE